MIFILAIFGLYSTIYSDEWNHHDLKNLLSHYIEMDCNDRFCLPKKYKYIMIDIGLSFNAPQSQIWLEICDSSLILAFEPAKTNWHQISTKCPAIPNWFGLEVIPHNHPIRQQSNLPVYWKKRFFPFHIALGNTNQKSAIFYETFQDSGCSSIYEPIEFSHTTYETPIVKLENFLNFFPFEDYPFIDYIKIDAQGADLDILKGMGNYLSERVICVTAEPEDNQYRGTCNSQNHIQNFMKSQGFKRIKNRRLEDPSWVNEKFINLFYQKKINKIIFQKG
jgi:hypothetical protein